MQIVYRWVTPMYTLGHHYSVYPGYNLKTVYRTTNTVCMGNSNDGNIKNIKNIWAPGVIIYMFTFWVCDSSILSEQTLKYVVVSYLNHCVFLHKVIYQKLVFAKSFGTAFHRTWNDKICLLKNKQAYI